MNVHFAGISAVQRLWLAAALCWGVLLTDSARAIDFVFAYDDLAGQGFLDPAQGAARRAALEAAGDVWGRLIRPAYAGEEIFVRASFQQNTPGSNALASAKPHYYYSDFGSSSPQYQADTYYPKALANHLAGGDLEPTRHEIEMTFNVATNFYLGVDGMPGAGQQDFVSVAAHEIGHGLGIIDSLRQDGEFGVYEDDTYDGFCIGCLAKPYDLFLTVGPSGQSLLTLTEAAREIAITSNNIFWNGPSGIAGNGGAPPKIFAPSPYNGGSSISHLDIATFPNALMAPTLSAGQVRQTVSAVERGILRDMGWSVAVSPQQIAWVGAGANNKASAPANWSPALPLPGDSLLFDNTGAFNEIDMDVVFYSLGAISFSAGAPARTLRFSPSSDTDMVAGGMLNTSGQLQSFILEARQPPITSGVDPSLETDAAKMSFSGSATAGNNVSYEVQAGGAGVHQPPQLPPSFQWSAGARISFNGNSTAGMASFVVNGGSGRIGPNAKVYFGGNATAGSADIWNKAGRAGIDLPLGSPLISGFGGETRFEGTSTAGTASFRNDGESEAREGTGGRTTFAHTSTAAQGTFTNFAATVLNGGLGGATQFKDSATAGAATFTNHGGDAFSGSGHTEFYDSATAGSAAITNEPGTATFGVGGITQFRNNSRAASATIDNHGTSVGVGASAGLTQFFDMSTANNATLRQSAGGFGGRTEFHNQSSAGDAILTLLPAGPGANGGSIAFHDDSTADDALFLLQTDSNGVIVFNQSATAANARFEQHDNSGTFISFFDDTSAATATFEVGSNGRLQFHGRSSAGNATIDFRPNSTGSFGGEFNALGAPTVTAGNAQITVEGASIPGGGVGQDGGSLEFITWSTAGSATINTHGGAVPGAVGGATNFDFEAHAGNATLITHGGVVGAAGGQTNFQRGAKGDNARVITHAGGTFSVAGNRTYIVTTVGSIEGEGTYHLSGAELETGSLNTDTTVSGPIIDFFTFGGKLTKVGTGHLTLAGNNTYTGLTTVNGGAVSVNGSIVGGALVNNGGTLRGTGAIGGTVTVNAGGVFSPGSSPGTITVGGLEILPGGILEFELGANRDHIVVNGNVSLEGTLNVSLLSGFAPELNQSFTLFEGAVGSITGVFDTTNLPIFDGRTFDILYNAGAVMLQVIDAILPSGDYNQNGTVDAADYTVWRDTLGQTVSIGSGADGSGDGTIGDEDYALWKSNFGASAGLGATAGLSSSEAATTSGATGSAHAAVPEPSIVWLVCLGWAGFCAVTRGR